MALRLSLEYKKDSQFWETETHVQCSIICSVEALRQAELVFGKAAHEFAPALRVADEIRVGADLNLFV